jgi:hypothetical protein
MVKLSLESDEIQGKTKMGKKIFFFFFILTFFFLGNLTAAEYKVDEKETFYSKSNRLIIQLEHSEKITLEGSDKVKEQNISDGTAFFVQSKEELYVVTARHVAEKDYDMHAKVRSINLKTGEIEVIYLNLPRNRWVYHPRQGEADTRYVDVAVMKVNWMMDHQVMTFLYAMDKQKEAQGNQLPLLDPEPPQPVLVFGFPSEIGFELTERRPLGRLGIVSMVAGNKFLKMEGKFVEERACLIDIEAWPGNSGSPVINQFNLITNPQIKLLGILFGTNPRRHYSMIEPVSRIRETLEIAKKQSLEGLNFWSLTAKNSGR